MYRLECNSQKQIILSIDIFQQFENKTKRSGFNVCYPRPRACSTDLAFPGHRAQAFYIQSRTPWGAHKQRSFISAASFYFIQ